ncbi:MAG: hypothetical protein J0H08_11320, partial [Rhizobiales bacterium]|nr:hypothetical protein [Hyphomicrobiales bacterium]
MKIRDGRSGRLATGVLLALAACLVFVLAAWTGGVTWDEQVHRNGAEDQFRIAADWLAGGPADFRTIPTDLAFYGTVPIAAAIAVDTLSAPLLGGPLGALAFGIWLHAFAFLFYGLAVVVAFAALRAAAVRPAV